MNHLIINHCPGTLAAGHSTYSATCIKRVFNGTKVNPILPYDAPNLNNVMDLQYLQNQARISISGAQEKFSVLIHKNKIRLTHQGEQGTHILKPIPSFGKNTNQMPANEHLTMQIARQVFGIETAENALLFFNNNEPAYITKRFDVQPNGTKLAQDDFASIAGRTPQTHGEHYKYNGNYLEIFQLMQTHLFTYKIESLKLFQLIIFNYLFSNGDAHFKNFSIIETPFGDYKLSPAYDLLNTRMHIADADFALAEGLLPNKITKGKIKNQFELLGKEAQISQLHINQIFKKMLSNSPKIKELIAASFLQEKFKRSYLQGYETRLNRMLKN
jgi:serine/threonine-protein kinase HipA